MARDKIKRSFIWIRNALRVIDKTTLPGEILGEVRPVMDTFGWERYNETTQSSFGGAAATNVVVSSPTPDNVMRLVTLASIESTDPAALTMWIAMRTEPGSIQLGISRPVTAIAGIQVGMTRKVLVPPGWRLVGRSVPAPAVATALTLRFTSVDIDIGEYVKSL